MKERLNELRLDAGISRTIDDSGLVVINLEGNIIDPLVGLEKFAELIVLECVTILREEGELAKIQASTSSTYKYFHMNEAANIVKQYFGVEE